MQPRPNLFYNLKVFRLDLLAPVFLALTNVSLVTELSHLLSLSEEGKNPFSLDSKEPNWANFHDFLLGEVRYLSVKKAYPNEAEELFAEAQKMAQQRYKTYVRKTQENWED